MSRFVSIVCTTLLLLTTLSERVLANERHPIPDVKSQANAAAIIATLYKPEYETARSSEEKLALAVKLIQVGEATNDDVAGRFVILRIARDIAVHNANLRIACAAIDLTSLYYDVDSLQMKLDAARRILPQLKTSDDFRRCIPSVQLAGEIAIRHDRIELAREASNLVSELATRTGDPVVNESAKSWRMSLDLITTEFDKIKIHHQRLKENPSDPAAKTAMGVFFCMVKGDWESGLPLLRDCDDQRLRAIASLELTADLNAVEVGDAWWNESSHYEGSKRELVRAHAARWYRRDLPTLNGLTRARIEQRIAVATDNTNENARRAMLLKALMWLASQQRPDGNWSFEVGPDAGSLKSVMAATSFAVTILIRDGNTSKEGLYATQVRTGLDYLVKKMQANGDLRNSKETMYSQGLGATALCEAYKSMRDLRTKSKAQAAINFIVDAQDKQGGGWRYQPRMQGDTSVLGWQMTPLILARETGLSVPDETMRGVTHFLNSVEANGGATYGYTTSELGESTTAIGLLARLQLGADKDKPSIKRGIEAIGAIGPSSNVYFNYYATLLMRQSGDDHWYRWREKLVNRLGETQSEVGLTAGSWFKGLESQGHVAKPAGRLGVTALCILALQAPDQ